MSADNMTLVGGFPLHEGEGREYRVAYNVSASVADELKTDLWTAEERKDILVQWFDSSSVFDDSKAAMMLAIEMEACNGATEYGASYTEFDEPFGVVGEEYEPEPLPEWACEKCSSPHGTITSHSENDVCPRDELHPLNTMTVILRDKFPGVNPHTLSRELFTQLGFKKNDNNEWVATACSP